MNRKLLATAICASLFVAGSAFAQDNSAPQQTQDQSTTNQSTTNQDQSNSQEEPKTLQAVTVTGSLLKRPEYQTTVPIQVVNIQAAKATGAFGTADILQSTAVAAGSTQINNQFSGFIVNGGTGVQPINLRGLGANRTLVLLDGQRPGPSGTQGTVGAFDLNVIPDVILQRVEIVKDGSSSIYGSDAISGVVNLITKKRLDGLELRASVAMPQHGGGEQYSASIGSGWNFDNGNVLVAAQFQEQAPIAYRDRDYFKCDQDMVWGTDGNRIDREDRSILQGTPEAGCYNNMWINSMIDITAPAFGLDGSTPRFTPSPDGTTQGPFPGYKVASLTRYDDPGVTRASYDYVRNFAAFDDAWAINKNRNSSLYASSHFTFGNIAWDNQFLYNHRETETNGWRQFFPAVFGPPNDINGTGAPVGVYEPIMPYPMDFGITVDYYYFHTKFSGYFENSDSWGWEVNATHTRSDGDYTHLGIDARVSGDLYSPVNTLDTPLVDYFDPAFLSGARMNDLINAVGLRFTGNTVYTQSTVNALFNGNLFELPAGPVAAAFGFEGRRYAIDDQPDPNNAAGYEWGFSSAQQTKGSDNVIEAFGEVGIPLLKGIPFVESLTVDLSARTFRYHTVGDFDKVWKTGLNWQITPTFRVRGTIGTSYRAPALYELYLGNQSGFLSQLGIDPCIDWQNSSNQFLQANCAAAGIPGNYAGGGSSAQVFSGGGLGFLDPEKSRAKSVGFVWTPAFGSFNLALDYFDYHIKGEIGTLDASDITFGCYGRPVYPNHFCDLFNRGSAENPYTITDIHATFININSERTRGYDFQLNWSNDFSFGTLKADAQVTYTIEDTQQLFSTAEASGFTATDFVGYIGRPRTVGLAHVSLERGDWTYTWQGFYTSSTENKDLNAIDSYYGYQNAFYDIKAGWQFRHSVSVGYDTGKWGATLGVRNLFDKQPDLVSAGTDSMIGNVPLSASQYDYFGRTFFVNAHYKF